MDNMITSSPILREMGEIMLVLKIWSFTAPTTILFYTMQKRVSVN